jgi:hypothetical protein
LENKAERNNPEGRNNLYKDMESHAIHKRELEIVHVTSDIHTQGAYQ